jgi:hypothetical protein
MQNHPPFSGGSQSEWSGREEWLVPGLRDGPPCCPVPFIHYAWKEFDTFYFLKIVLLLFNILENP